MEKKIAGLLGAVALGAMGSAQAAPAPTDPLQVNSYADLLEPVPNAGAVLQALDEQAPAGSTQGTVTQGSVRLAQAHHHHHHHSSYRRAPRVVIVPPHRHRYHHHHHHHHHNHY